MLSTLFHHSREPLLVQARKLFLFLTITSEILYLRPFVCLRYYLIFVQVFIQFLISQRSRVRIPYKPEFFFSGFLFAAAKVAYITAMIFIDIILHSAVHMYYFHIQLFRERLSEKVHATIPKGIVGGFEFTFLHRNLKEWHLRPWAYVCEC